MGDSEGHGSGDMAEEVRSEGIIEEGSDNEDIASTYYFNDLQDMKEHMSSPQTRSREDKKQRQVGHIFFLFVFSVACCVS